MLCALVLFITLVAPSTLADCPCSNANLCNQITTQFDKELFTFQAFGDEWHNYEWDKVENLQSNLTYLRLQQ